MLVETCVATRHHKSFKHARIKCAFAYVYIDFFLEMVIDEESVDIA